MGSGSGAARSFARIEREVVACRRCPRLTDWRERAAANPPRRFRGETYWARPLPAFGDPGARLLLVGLAPAANGANRTGRLFTGDESGRFLFRALHAVGLSNLSFSRHADDGLRLSGALLTAACRCAPPENRPTPEEFARCRGYLERELELTAGPRVLVAFGALAFEQCWKALERGSPPVSARPRFAHGARQEAGPNVLYGSYHPSQQNTFTGRLTQRMLRDVLRRAAREAERIGGREHGGSTTGDARVVWDPSLRSG
jgi:uracil-DNA glycosylase family 4